MKSTLAALGILTAAGSLSWAYVSVDCNTDIRVESSIRSFSLDQEVGSERIDCRTDSSGAVGEVRVVRKAKSTASARAYASARADGRAYARYSDSCSTHCSCSGSSCGSCSGSCHTSGSGSDWCSDSDSDEASRSETEETTFVVARASLASLASKGFGARAGSGSHPCEVVDSSGSPLDALRAIAVVTWVYGEDLMKEKGADLSASGKLTGPKLGNPPKASKPESFDGERKP